MAHLQLWSKEEFDGKKRKVDGLINKLKEAKKKNLKWENGNEIRKIERQINNFLIDEEIYWKQRSMADWLREGDKNTKYFHHKASARKRKNKIWGVEDKDGKWTEDTQEVEREFCDFYYNLFTTSCPSQDHITTALLSLEPNMNDEMRSQLDEPFTVEEIKVALK